MATVDVPFDNPLFGAYGFYCSVLILKIMFMSNLTSINRLITKAFISPEDVARWKGKVRQDDKVERIRRAHLNDLENIPIFCIVCWVYIQTNPSYFVATSLLKAFTFARFIHTFVYAVIVVPQPARFLAFAVGYLITAYMAVQNLIYFFV